MRLGTDSREVSTERLQILATGWVPQQSASVNGPLQPLSAFHLARNRFFETEAAVGIDKRGHPETVGVRPVRKFRKRPGLPYDDIETIGRVCFTDLFIGQNRRIASHQLPNYFGDMNVGQWRSPVPMAFLFMAFVAPFTLNRVSQFRPPPPPPLNSVAYLREYEEVKARGDANAHPNSETDVARFWSGNVGAQFNGAMRQTANAQGLSVGDSARMFALANIAAADTAMAVWESKYFYNFWRPITAIQEGENDGIARTEGNVTWAPLLGTPPYPDYVSGANGFTGVFTGMLELFFGTDQMNFSVINFNPLLIQTERFYTRFSEAAEEVVDARILLGIHFRTADVEARRLGNRIAHWTFQKFLRPVPGSE